VRVRVLAGLLGLAVVLGGRTASATLIIDSFEEAPFTLMTPASPLSQTGLSTANVIGGQRDISVQSFTGGAPTTVSLSLTVDDDAAMLTSTFSGGSATFGYPLGGVADLTVGGTLNRFEIVVSGVDELLCATANNCQVQVAHGFEGTFSFASVDVLTDGVLTVPYSAFGSADFTKVDELRFFPIVRDEGGYSVSEFRAVPEPSTAAMLAAALAGLALRRRHGYLSSDA
jgi:hypothetical protein